MLALGGLVAQFVRHRDYRYYGYAIVARSGILSCSVAVRIAAPPDRVWQLLTDAERYTQWNSTLTSLEGAIVLGGVVKMRGPEAPGRTFSPKVTVFDVHRRMVWRDGFAPMFVGKRTDDRDVPRADAAAHCWTTPQRRIDLRALRGGLETCGRGDAARGWPAQLTPVRHIATLRDLGRNRGLRVYVLPRLSLHHDLTLALATGLACGRYSCSPTGPPWPS